MLLDSSFKPQVMIPPEYIKWMIEQPETVLSTRPQLERFGYTYLVPTVDTHHSQFITTVIRKHLTPNLGVLQPNMFHDIRDKIDSLMGQDEESWREICLMDVISKTVFKATNRVFLGSPLCEDEGYLRSSASFSNWLGAGAIIVGQLLPPLLKPFFGYCMAIPIYVQQRLSYRYLIPLFEKRIEDMTRKREDPSFKFEEPRDLVSWVVATALEDRKIAPECKPTALAEHLLFTVSIDAYLESICLLSRMTALIKFGRH